MRLKSLRNMAKCPNLDTCWTLGLHTSTVFSTKPKGYTLPLRARARPHGLTPSYGGLQSSGVPPKAGFCARLFLTRGGSVCDRPGSITVGGVLCGGWR